MSLQTLGVIAVGLLVGYWVVSALLDAWSARTTKRASGPRKAPWNDARQEGGQNRQGQRQERSEEQHSHRAGPDTHDTPAWWTVLQVSPHASASEIRSAYRTQISKHHPDKVAQLGDELRALAERKSKDINAAYEQAMRERGG